MGKRRRTFATGLLASLALAACPSAAGAAASPTALAFGDQRLGTTSAERPVTVSGTPGETVSVAESGPAAGDYTVTPASALTLGPSGSATYQVAFTPTATGSRTARLTFTRSVAPNVITGTDAVDLTGTGTAPAAALEPASLEFGEQQTGTISSAQAVTLRNTGSAPLAISSIAAGGDFAVGHYCPASVAPGDSCTIGVVFTPGVAGPRSGALTVVHDGSGSRTVALSGTGVAPPAPGPPPPPGVPPNVTVQSPRAGQTMRQSRRVRRKGKVIRQRVDLLFFGQAVDSDGLLKVELAIVRALPDGSCQYFDGRRSLKRGPCWQARFFRVELDDYFWSYRLKGTVSMPRGDWLVVVRAIDLKGLFGSAPFVPFRIR